MRWESVKIETLRVGTVVVKLDYTSGRARLTPPLRRFAARGWGTRTLTLSFEWATRSTGLKGLGKSRIADPFA